MVYKIIRIALITVLALLLILALSYNGSNHNSGNVIPDDHVHTEGAVTMENVVLPTCSADGGYDNVLRCSQCEAEMSRTSYVLPSVDHVYSEPVRENEVEATCLEEGGYDKVIYCSFCNLELSRDYISVGMVEHNPGEPIEEVKVPAGCKVGGLCDSVVKCTWCETELSRTEKHISPARHSWSEYKCTKCGIDYSVAEALDLALSEDGTYYMVVGYGSCLEVDLVIPSHYNGLPIKEIANYAFYNCYLIESAYIPSTITRIGYGAAWGCTSLQKLLIEDKNGWYLMEGYDDTEGLAIPAIFLYDTSMYLSKLTGGDYFWLTKEEK